MTFRDLLKDALIEIGVLAEGENPTAEALTSGMRTFNRMLGNWSTQNLLIYARTEETFPLVANQGTYLMGPSGNFNTVRPQYIGGISLIDDTNEYPMRELTEDEWQCIQLKDTGSNFPIKYYVNCTNPKLTLNFWPLPSEAKSVKIYSESPLTSVTDAGAAIVYPEGYDMPLMYNFAILLASGYGRQVSPVTASVATKSLADIKRRNIRPKVMGTDAALRARRRYNIYSGDT